MQQWLNETILPIFEDWGSLQTDWPTGPDPAWMRHEEIPVQPIPMSAYSHRWQESFRKRRCPHGTRIYSPEDQCDTCVIECYDSPPVHVNLVLAPDYWEDNQSEQPKETQVLVKKLDPQAQIPKQATKGDAGYDLRTLKGITIGPGDTALIDTGLAFELPPGVMAKIFSRSGLAQAGYIARGGVVDPGY